MSLREILSSEGLISSQKGDEANNARWIQAVADEAGLRVKMERVAPDRGVGKVGRFTVEVDKGATWKISIKYNQTRVIEDAPPKDAKVRLAEIKSDLDALLR